MARLLVCLYLLGTPVAWGQQENPGLSIEEAGWLLMNPDVAADLMQLPPDQLLKFMEVYQGLSPEEQRKLRDNAGEFKGLSAEERAWALDNPDAVRQLDRLSDAERRQLLELYRNADPATQRGLRIIKP